MASSTAHLHALGFCGADDSVDPHLLLLISKAYPFVEWGVLFRPDKVGTPRYASDEWVERLSLAARSSNGELRRRFYGTSNPTTDSSVRIRPCRQLLCHF